MGIGGGPISYGTPDHPRRCKGTSRRRKARGDPDPRCRRWAARGYDYCKKHNGGTRPLINMGKRNTYSNRVGATLQARLAELAEEPPHERHSLQNEVDVMRLAASEALAIFDLVCIQEADKSSAGLKANAASVVKDAMQSVALVVEKAAKVRAISQSTIDLEFLDFVVGQVQRIIERHVTPISLDAVDRIVNELNEIALPDRLHKKAAPAAARQIREAMSAMDQSIPKDESA